MTNEDRIVLNEIRDYVRSIAWRNHNALLNELKKINQNLDRLLRTVHDNLPPVLGNRGD